MDPKVQKFERDMEAPSDVAAALGVVGNESARVIVSALAGF